MTKVFRPRPKMMHMRHYHELDLWRRYADDMDIPSIIGSESKFIDVEDEMMIWIDKNCVGEVMYDENMYFYFEHTSDRIAFKLAWK